MALLNPDQLLAQYGRALDDLEALPRLALQDLGLVQRDPTALVARRDPLRNPTITVPGFEDVFRLVPEQWLPPDERRRRQTDRIARLQASPQPESVRALTRIVTAVDDIQDALVTSSVLLRIGALAYPPLRPLAVGLGAAADATNALNLITALPLAPLSGKIPWKQLARAGLGSTAARALNVPTLRQALPTIGEAFQVLQTTEDLFGVGIQLGPLMGFVPDVIYGIPQNADFALPDRLPFREDDDVFSTPANLALAVTRSIDGLLGTVLRAPAALAELVGLTQDLPWDDHLEALITANLGAELGRAMLAPSRWPPFLAPRLNQPDPPYTPKKFSTRRALIARGIEPDRPAPRALPGAAPGLPLASILPSIRRAGATKTPELLREAPTPELRHFASSLASDLPFRLLRAFEGPGARFEAHDAIPTRVVTDTIELGLIPPPGSTPSQVSDYQTRGARLYQAPDDRTPEKALRDLHTVVFMTHPA